jgi:GTP cyclohydrolase I
MTLRGVRSPGATLTTSRMMGVLRDDARTREEFLALTRQRN